MAIEIVTLYKDKDSDIALAHRTRVSAISDANGIGLSALNAGLQFLPELQMGLYFDSMNKLGNLWEDAYNGIKEGAAAVKGKTLAEIEAHNRKRIEECMELDIAPTGTLNADLLMFVDAEDC